MPCLLHVLLFFLTGGLYLLVYIPFAVMKGAFRRKEVKPQALQDREGYIYLIHAQGTEQYKIGRTNDVGRRLQELTATKGPFPLKLLEYVEVKDDVRAEKQLHRQFAQWRRHGEWFNLNKRQLKQVRKAMRKVAR